MTSNLLLLSPEIFLSLVALGILVGETVFTTFRKGWLYVAVAALALAGGHAAVFSIGGEFLGAPAGIAPAASREGWIQFGPVFGMISVDTMAAFFKVAIAGAVILVLWLSVDYWEYEGDTLGTYAAMMLLATVGMFFLVGSVDFLIAVIALELLSIASFVLTGFVFQRRSSNEAAIKFFLVGTFSTGVLLFGISLYYGYFGSTSLEPFLQWVSARQAPDMPLSVILILLISGLGFKLAMVPFHMWAPDAYEGAPTPVTGFLSVAPKAAAIGFLLRLIGDHASLNLTPVLVVLATLTMTVGNIGALHQTNVKRLLAYSSIAQVGYILVALVCGGAMGGAAAMLYTFVYLFMNLGVFAVLTMISNQVHAEDITVFSGLARRSLGLALVVVVFLLSLTGIPPLAGFVGKFTIFAAVIHQEGLLWLAIVAILNSVVSLYYYFRIAQQMFFREGEPAPMPLSPALFCSVAVALGVTFIFGILPNSLLLWIGKVIGS